MCTDKSVHMDLRVLKKKALYRSWRNGYYLWMWTFTELQTTSFIESTGVTGSDSANQVQSLKKAICISQSANTLWKYMNPKIHPTAIGK